MKTKLLTTAIACALLISITGCAADNTAQMLHDNAEVTVNTEAVTEPSADTQTVTLTAETAEKEIYPQLIDEATLEKMRSRKTSRNTQSGTDRRSGIYLLKAPIICPSCCEPMRRLQDARCKCTQKWVCSQCNTQIKIEDAVLMDEITDLLNALICNPDMLHSHQYCQKEPPVEQRRLDNEIARTLKGYDFDKDALREKLFQRADLCYQQIGNEAYIENQLRCTLEQTESLESFDAELTNKIVKQIRLSEDGSVRIMLINDQEIRKEQTDHASNSPSDAT